MSLYRIIAQVVATASQIVVRSFTRALRQELAATNAHKTQQKTRDEAPPPIFTSKMTLEEAMKILNVDDLNPIKIDEHYKRMFEANSHSFYLKSKVYRAKERLDEEMQSRTQQ